MAQILVSMKTIDLRQAQLQPVAGEDVKTLQALLNLFLTVGEDGTLIPPLTLDGTASAKTKQAAQPSRQRPMSPPYAVVGPLPWKKLVEQEF